MALPIDSPFVFVLWTDAVARNGWSPLEDDDTADGIELVWSAGWMYHRTAHEVRLTADVGTNNTDTNRRLAIPMGMVQLIREGNLNDGPVIYQRKGRPRLGVATRRPRGARPVPAPAAEAVRDHGRSPDGGGDQ